MPIKNARAKGAQFELAVVKLFKELGWEECGTSRNESKKLDDQGVDLVCTDPFQIQCKAVESLGPYHKILDRMVTKKGKTNLVFHKKNRNGVVVAMRLEDFISIVEKLIKCGIINPNE